MDTERKLRVIYWLALANLAVLIVWGVAFDLPAMLSSVAGLDMSPFLVGADGFLVACGAVAAVPLGILIRYPHGWGKLLLPVYGLSWIMHGVAIMLMSATWAARLHVAGAWTPIACGVFMISLAVAHQIVDPSFFRSRST